MNFDTTCAKTEFEKSGFVFCESFFSRAKIDEIDTQLNRVISDLKDWPREHVFFEDRDDTSSLKQLQQLQHHDSYFAELMNDQPRKLAEQLFGAESVAVNMQFFNKPAGIGKPTPPHQDGYYFKLSPCEAVTMWLALEPVDEENGCVRYIPGSHLKEMREHSQTNTLGFSQGIVDYPTASDKELEVAMPAQPGDLLAHHALTIHRADGNRSQTRSRRALGFIFYSINAKEDVEAHRRYQRELKQSMISKEQI